jgi:hypothetical protein
MVRHHGGAIECARDDCKQVFDTPGDIVEHRREAHSPDPGHPAVQLLEDATGL